MCHFLYRLRNQRLNVHFHRLQSFFNFILILHFLIILFINFFLFFIQQVLAALSVSLGSMVVGFSSAYTSPALVSMTDRNVTSFDITDSEVIFLFTFLCFACIKKLRYKPSMLLKLCRYFNVLIRPVLTMAFILLAFWVAHELLLKLLDLHQWIYSLLLSRHVYKDNQSIEFFGLMEVID